MRGEHCRRCFAFRRSGGSSPHARGTPERHVLDEDADGIIPACAGNTAEWFASAGPARDHPRMRGEHTMRNFPYLRDEGSSPHARGTRVLHGLCDGVGGIIPACAGNTKLAEYGFRLGGDHPRMRGEHIKYAVEGATSQGSSPHARGTPDAHWRHPHDRGIIPACAGNTGLGALLLCVYWDHPRMRGEHVYDLYLSWQGRGSSPHARGTPSWREVRDMLCGIIPACAGNTRPRQAGNRPDGDHPRMRGEHYLTNVDDLQVVGSSPHARGTPTGNVGGAAGAGIIPACAGNT